MTSKERVLAAFHHTEPDRVPINYSANPGINARLIEYLGLAPGDDAGLAEALGVDFRGVGVPYVGPRLHQEVSDRHVDPLWGWHCRRIEHETGGYWDYCDFPLKGADAETVAAWPMPSPDDFDYSRVAEACRANSKFAVHVGHAGLGTVINQNGHLFSLEEALIGLALDDEAMLELADRRLAVTLEVTRRTIEAADGGIDFLWMGEDLGTQRSPIISMELFRKHIRPRHQRFVDLAKAYDLPVMIHTCGSSSWAYEDFIEMGISAVETLQPEAADMSPKYLKERFGGRLAFHGCISTAGPVAYGTVDEVVADCRATLDTMMPGGGYMFAPTHSLQDNSPVENVAAMYECAKTYGGF